MIPQPTRDEARALLCRQIGTALSAAMTQSGLTVPDVAARLSMEPGPVYRWMRRLEQGTLRNLDPVTDLVAALGCELTVTASVRVEQVAA